MLSNFQKTKITRFLPQFQGGSHNLILNKRAFIHPKNWSQDQIEGSIEKTKQKKTQRVRTRIKGSLQNQELDNIEMNLI
jgi:hypothetical protein